MISRLKTWLHDLQSEQKRDPALQAIEWFSLREVRERTTLHAARDGHPDSNIVQETHGVMIEVRTRGQLGYAATADLTLSGLRQAFRHAGQVAITSAARGVYPFGTDVRPASRGEYRSEVTRAFGSKTPGQWNDLLVTITQKLRRSPAIIRTQALARLVEMESGWVSTSGAEVEQNFSLISTDFSATAQSGKVVQKRSDGGMLARSLQGGLEVFETPDIWHRVETVAEEAVALSLAEECPTETTSLVLMPDQMMLQIHESIGHPLEIDRILGDERNYAGSSFVKLADFGVLQYGSPLLNVVYDPTVTEEYASFGYDDYGAPTRREYMIQNGKLLRGIGGLESQARSKIAGVSTARASSWNRPPIDRMSNLNIESGNSTFDEIIASTERGVLMASNRSWSIDDYRNKFQFGCEYGRLIENGKLTRIVRNPNYRGITLPFWRSLVQVGNSLTREVFGTPYCGKGEPNQVIRVGHASPVCKFENIEVFGGGA